MANKRMINCDFINSSSFTNLSNKAKLLYLFMLTNADDKGFVDTTCDLANMLESKEEPDQTLIPYTYFDATADLVNKGLIFEFKNRHGNVVHLVRHWFYHNKNLKYMETNYLSLLEQVEVEDNEYVLKEKGREENKEKMGRDEMRRDENEGKKEIIKESNSCRLSRNEMLEMLEGDTNDSGDLSAELERFCKERGIESAWQMTYEQAEEWRKFVLRFSENKKGEQ